MKSKLLVFDVGLAVAIAITLGMLTMGALEMIDLDQVSYFMDIFSMVLLIFVMLGVRTALSKK